MLPYITVLSLVQNVWQCGLRQGRNKQLPRRVRKDPLGREMPNKLANIILERSFDGLDWLASSGELDTWLESPLAFPEATSFPPNHSPHQASALELSLRHASDLLVALGTGGGESLLFMACAANVEEEGNITIVAVPSTHWFNQLKDCLKEARVRVIEKLR